MQQTMTIYMYMNVHVENVRQTKRSSPNKARVEGPPYQHTTHHAYVHTAQLLVVTGSITMATETLPYHPAKTAE